MPFLYSKEITDDSVMTRKTVMRDNTYMEITTAKRVFHVDGDGASAGADYLDYMAKAGNITGLPVLNHTSVRVGDGSTELIAKKYDIIAQDAYVAKIVVTYDDDPYTNEVIPGLEPIEEWVFRTRMVTRNTYVDVNGNPIYTNYQNIGAANIDVGNRKSTSVTQSYPQLEMVLTQYDRAENVPDRYEWYVGKINDSPFPKQGQYNPSGVQFDPGMVRFEGFSATPILNRKADDLPARSVFTYSVKLTFLTAGPKEIVASTIGRGKDTKYGWAGLAYFTDPKTNDVIRNKKGTVVTEDNVKGSVGAAEVIVPLYEMADLNVVFDY